MQEDFQSVCEVDKMLVVRCKGNGLFALRVLQVGEQDMMQKEVRLSHNISKDIRQRCTKYTHASHMTEDGEGQARPSGRFHLDTNDDALVHQHRFEACQSM